ncbi:alpha-2,8-polysialyltransferase family protein [Acinetobacter sp. ANC 5414]|uniref:alpha-2,8-polysialyltransferase family protein n=1 Tax=Acinetobacter sp. ANC 5414 TaxID=2731251 RepID=UPI00148F4762|nr:hypothetical protein [Acinetobacter sp. ANC 5414]
MSKLTKFIKSPREFIKDSIYFGYPDLSINKCDNLFFITTLGQLRNAENLIEIQGLKNSNLIILYTLANKNMPNLIKKSVNKKLFQSIEMLKIPKRPSILDIYKARYFINSYFLVLIKAKPKKLFLFSFESHYTILQKIAKINKVKICIVEEGTGTYKNKASIEKIDSTVKEKILKKLPLLNNFDGYFNEVDKVYASFPNLIQKDFSAEEYNTFFYPILHAYKNNLSVLSKYNITSNDSIYVNQSFNLHTIDHVNSALTILNQISLKFNSNIYIKMHPKDSEKLKIIFKKETERFENLIYIDEESFLVEPMLSAVNPKLIIGLTSTSLVYAPLISKGTQVLSIANEFINNIEYSKRNARGIDTIKDHFTILYNFNNIFEYFNGEIKPLGKTKKTEFYFEDFIFFKIVGELDYFYENVVEGLDNICYDSEEELFYFFKNKYGVNSAFEKIHLIDILSLDFSSYKLNNDFSFLAKYLNVLKYKVENPYKSFYYLVLIVSQLGFLPSYLVNDYLLLLYKNDLYFNRKDEVISILKNNISIIDFENINRYILFIPEVFLNSKSCELNLLAKYSIDFFENNQNEYECFSEFEIFLDIFFKTLIFLRDGTKFNFVDRRNEFLDQDLKKIYCLCLMISNNQKFKKHDELNTNSSDYSGFILILEVFYNTRHSFLDLKKNLIFIEKNNIDSLFFGNIFLSYSRKLNKQKNFNITFDQLFSKGLPISTSNILYFIENDEDFLKMSVFLESRYFDNLNYCVYYTCVKKFIDFYSISKNTKVFIFFEKYENVEFNHQILTDGYFYNDIVSLEVFKKYFQF